MEVECNYFNIDIRIDQNDLIHPELHPYDETHDLAVEVAQFLKSQGYTHIKQTGISFTPQNKGLRYGKY